MYHMIKDKKVIMMEDKLRLGYRNFNLDISMDLK